MHSFTHLESKPAGDVLTVPQTAAHPLHTLRLRQTLIQAPTVAAHADGSGAGVDTGVLTRLTLTHTLLQHHRPVCCHADVS